LDYGIYRTVFYVSAGFWVIGNFALHYQVSNTVLASEGLLRLCTCRIKEKRGGNPASTLGCKK
jgi:hypothetical protein